MEYEHQWVSEHRSTDGKEVIHRITLSGKKVNIEYYGDFQGHIKWLPIVMARFNTVGEAAAFVATLVDSTL